MSFVNPASALRPPPALTPRQVAHRLGLAEKHGRKTVERMLQRGEFVGAFKVGRQWRVPPAVLDAWVAAEAARAQEQARGRRGGRSSRVPSGSTASPESRRTAARALASARK